MIEGPKHQTLVGRYCVFPYGSSMLEAECRQRVLLWAYHALQNLSAYHRLQHIYLYTILRTSWFCASGVDPPRNKSSYGGATIKTTKHKWNMWQRIGAKIYCCSLECFRHTNGITNKCVGYEIIWVETIWNSCLWNELMGVNQLNCCIWITLLEWHRGICAKPDGYSTDDTYICPHPLAGGYAIRLCWCTTIYSTW